MPTLRHCGLMLSAAVGEVKRRFSALQARTAFSSFAVSEAQGFLSLFCGLSLSFVRKKEKPPSWFNLTSAVWKRGGCC
jgi:hypothetical protein